jgi:hypothetical protein
LVSDDEVMLACEQVDDFPFGFVSPLQSDNAGGGHVLNQVQRDIRPTYNELLYRRGARGETAN